MIEEIIKAIASDDVNALKASSNDLNFEEMLDVRKSRHDCILCHSALLGSVNCLEYLFGLGFMCSHIKKPLIYNSACGGSLSIIQFLTQNGVSPYGALRGALRHGHQEIVLYLLINEYEVFINELEDHSFVMDAIRGGNIESLKTIIEQKPEIISYVSDSGETPLFAAAKYGNDEILHYLIEHALGELNNKILEAAIRSRQWKAVKELIGKSGIDFSKPNEKGKTPLDIVLEVGNSDIILVLMKFMQLPNDFYAKAFFQAVKNGQIEIVDVFMKVGVNINMRNERGQTPLHIAAMNGNEEMVQKILSSPSVDLSIRDKKRETALIKAKSAKIRSMIQGYQNKSQPKRK